MEKEMAAPMFQGFSQQTNDFLWGIRFNNERSWFEAHKQTYLDQVQAPLRELAQAVYQQFSARHQDLPLMVRVSRIYRDARRLFGRGPYKSHLWFSLRIAGEDWAAHPVLWFEIFPAGYAYGMGIYDAKPATMARFRQDMDQHPQKMGKLARAFQKQDRFHLEGEEYKRPKGHPKPPLDQWYNRKNLDLLCQREIDPLLYSPDLVGEVVGAFEELLPYYRYFSDLCSRGD